MYDFLIVGAGLYGATFARLATDAGFSCLVIDKRSHVAGNAYTVPRDDYYIHKYGPHIFHTDDDDIWKFVNQYAQFNRFTNQPVANYNGKLYSLPFNMNTFYQVFGVTDPKGAKQMIEAEIRAAGITEIHNLEEQAISMVGTTIYERLVKCYTEKQWGRPCNELPPEIIRRLPLRFTYDNAYFNDRYQGIPEDGYTALVKRMLSGIEVRTHVDFFRDRFSCEKAAKRIVYTGPIDAFFDFRYGKLEYRSLRFYEHSCFADNAQGTAVMNFTDDKTPWTRRIEHKHFTGSTCPGTFLTFEFSIPASTENEPYYPVNDKKNIILYKQYRYDASKLKNVVIGGRLGTYRYMDMDDTIMLAKNDFDETLKHLENTEILT